MIPLISDLTSFLQLWFAEVLRDAFAAQLAGVFAPFKDYAGHHLARRITNKDTTSTSTPEEAAEKLAQSFAAAEPYPDVSIGITQIQMAKKIKVAFLTNGSVQIATAVLEKADLLNNNEKKAEISAAADSISIFDINETLAWKPAKEAYHFICNALALPPSQVLMVASHPWDVHGALQAGLKAAYVQRDPSAPYPEFLDQPQVVVKDFKELAQTLLLHKT